MTADYTITNHYTGPECRVMEEDATEVKVALHLWSDMLDTRSPRKQRHYQCVVAGTERVISGRILYRMEPANAVGSNGWLIIRKGA